MRRPIILAVAITLLVTGQLRAQCSDGGVCTLTSSSSQTAHALTLGYGYGASPSEDDLRFHSVRLASEIRLFEDSRVDIVLPFNAQSGPLGTVSGIGDLIMVWTQSISLAQDASLEAQVGGRFRTADVNAGGLPQAYQSGLGTNDLLLGVGYSTGSLSAGFGYQLSRGRSANAVTRLKRGDDVMVRASYSASLGDLGLTGEVLGIKRLDLSSIRDSSAGATESFVMIPESDQLQINILAGVHYPISETLALSLSSAIPLLKREINVDGLSRSFTISIGLRAEF